jgi:hypothetical protein
LTFTQGGSRSRNNAQVYFGRLERVELKVIEVSATPCTFQQGARPVAPVGANIEHRQRLPNRRGG